LTQIKGRCGPRRIDGSSTCAHASWAIAMNNAKSSPQALTWDIAVPLLSNSLIAGATVKVFMLAAGISAAMMSLIFAVQGDTDSILTIWMAFGAAGVGLSLMALLIMLVVFGNRMHCRISIDGNGIQFASVDRRAKVGNRLLLLLGLLLRRPQAIGAGLIARSQELSSLRWRGAFAAEYRPQRHLVILRNRWRRLLIVYATPENYAQVAERIRAEMDRHDTESRVQVRSPLPRYLLRTALVVLACVPLLALVDAFDLSLMLPLLQLCFGIATVWLIGLFGYVLLAVDVLILAALLMGALGTRESWLHRGEYYASWTVYSDQDWALLVLALLAMAVLALIGWRGARGRWPAMLMADLSDAGD
jgi:hypothetical protein